MPFGACNPEVEKLAIQVSEAQSEEIPSLLVQLQGILQQYQENSIERKKLLHDILEYDLLSWCCLVLKYDFSKIKGGFHTAVTLIKILFGSCTHLTSDSSSEFWQTNLPYSLHSALLIAWNIQEQIIEMSKSTGAGKFGKYSELDTLKIQFQSVLDSVSSVTTSHSYLVNTLLKSENLIRILIDEVDISVGMVLFTLNMILRAIRVNFRAIKTISSSALNHLMDELIYKVTTSQHDELAAVTIKIIVAMVDADSEIADKLTLRFKGLKALLTRWMGHGFDHTLRKLIDILDAGNSKIAELSRRSHAVKTIWAAYKGWKTRTRVNKLHKVVPSLQSSFRRKRREKLNFELVLKTQQEHDRNTELMRKRSVRSSKEKQLQMLEIVPAKIVNQHIQKEEEKAATKVQSAWRGFMQRKKYSDQQFVYYASKAAIVIQRAFRKFLAIKEAKQKATMPLAKHDLFTNEQRENFQLKIKQWYVVRGTKETTTEELKKTHDQTQHRLLIYHTKQAENALVNDPKIEALLAKIHTEEELLSNISCLSKVTLEDVDRLACTSTAVKMAAEMDHKRMMDELTSPWWKKLSLKSGESGDPFKDKSDPLFDTFSDEIEEFMNPNTKQNVIF